MRLHEAVGLGIGERAVQRSGEGDIDGERSPEKAGALAGKEAARAGAEGRIGGGRGPERDRMGRNGRVSAFGTRWAGADVSMQVPGSHWVFTRTDSLRLARKGLLWTSWRDDDAMGESRDGSWKQFRV